MRVLVPARRSRSERIDRKDNDPKDLNAALHDIHAVNRLLGGERVLLRALDRHLEDAPGGVVRILDVGTGLGDLPVAMVRWGRRRGLAIKVTAVDNDPVTTEAAARFVSAEDAVSVVRADAAALPFPDGSFDLVTCSMFLHHFRHEQIVPLLSSFRSVARSAVVVNDLRRHVLPWAFIAIAARLTRRHPMFVHDAPLSVLKGFTAQELLSLARESGGSGARVRRVWPFRLVLTVPGSRAA